MADTGIAGTATFFDKPTPQSKAKARIVSNYFKAWADVIVPRVRGTDSRILYLDLYAGKGRYADGTPSTPLLILNHAIKTPELGGRLVSIFNDHNRRNASTMRKEISSLPDVTSLRYSPQIYEYDVGDQVVEFLRANRLGPTLFFADPFGYKGLTLDLVNSVIKDWACECIFFFNYNRVSAGLNNSVVRNHMDRMFGHDRAEYLRQQLHHSSPEEREDAILAEINRALTDIYGRHVISFCFKRNDGTRTSHYLIFVTKHFLGYHIMKEIMAAESTLEQQGVPTYTFNPANIWQMRLLQAERPLDDLIDMLPVDFAGQTLSMVQAYEAHSAGRRYVKKNYKTAFLALEAQGRISVDSRGRRRRANTFADDLLVTFPLRGRL